MDSNTIAQIGSGREGSLAEVGDGDGDEEGDEDEVDDEVGAELGDVEGDGDGVEDGAAKQAVAAMEANCPEPQGTH